jgi:hypothetical protein
MEERITRIEIAAGEALLEKLDAWRGERAAKLSREQAVLDLVERGLSDVHRVQISDGEKLIVLLLTAMSKGSGRQLIDADIIRNAVRGGHYWALDWQYPALFNRHHSDRTQADFVCRTLEMWIRIEASYARLSAGDRQTFAERSGLTAPLEFPGWHAESDVVSMQIAHFITADLKLYSQLKGRSGRNCRAPAAKIYERMLARFDDMRHAPADQPIGVEELAVLVRECLPLLAN